MAIGVAAACPLPDGAVDVAATWCPSTWHSLGVPEDLLERQFMTALDVHASQDRGCWVVRLQDDIDHATVPYWKSVLDLLSRDARVTLDLDAVRYVDSAGIALLLWLRRRLTGAGGQLALARSPSFLDRIFRVAGIPSLIPCYADLSAALDALCPISARGVRLDETSRRAATA